MVTIRDVAREAGVSIGTVSRVMSGSTATSESSRSRVREVAARLSYAPNVQARSLRGAGTGVLGLLVPDMRNPYFAELAHAAEQEALRHGSVTVVANADEDEAQQDRYIQTLRKQRVDGFIVVPQSERSEELCALVETGGAIVFADRRVDGLKVPAVTFDVAGGMRLALEHLASLGHRRIGYIGGPLSTSTGRDRKRAFDTVCRELELDLDPALTALGNNRTSGGAVAIAGFLGMRRPPTAIITSNALLALGALLTLRQHGLRNGHDLELLSYDDEAWMPLVEPGLTVIAHDPDIMGATAMRLLFERMGGGTPDSVLLPTRLATRGRPT